MNITPEQFEALSHGEKWIVFIIKSFELWLEIAKAIWPILIWRILSVLKGIRAELKKQGAKS